MVDGLLRGHRVLHLVLVLEVGLTNVLVFAYQYLIGGVDLPRLLLSARLISSRV